MKRLICLVCALVLALTPVSCQKKDGEATTQNTTEAAEPVKYTHDQLYEMVMGWKDNTAWDITFTSVATIVDDGDTENANGYFVGFDGAMIPAEKGNMYHGDTLAMNSYVAFELAYEMYYYDGWAYQIYKEPTGVEELDSYERYETNEETFRADFDGIVPIFVTESEFMSGKLSSTDGATMISITLGEGRARDELLCDIETIADNSGVSVDDIDIVAAAISYAVEDGELTAFIGTFTLEFPVDGVVREYSLEKTAIINAVGDEVETFTLPKDAENYEVFDIEG